MSASYPPEGWFPSARDLRVIVWCPTGRDSLLARETLSAADIQTVGCSSGDELMALLDEGVGAVIAAQEVLTNGVAWRLAAFLAAQPRWSDLEVVVLGYRGAEQDRRAQVLDMLPNCTILDRPLRKDLLVQAARAALRSRRRQYELRDHLTAREAILRDLETASAAKDEFLGLVSHELRTPTSTIVGGAKLLRRSSPQLTEQDRMELIVGIDEAADRLVSTVDNLMLLARGDPVDVREPLLVPRTIKRVVDLFQRSHPARAIRVDVPDTIAMAACNEQLFFHVMENLLTNAVKYSPASEPIDVCAADTPEGVEIVIADRGPGVKEEELDLIFQRFYRSDATARTASGLGLGLTVCRRLIESQGGRIWACPRDGGGLEMRFSLPPAESFQP